MNLLATLKAIKSDKLHRVFRSRSTPLFCLCFLFSAGEVLLGYKSFLVMAMAMVFTLASELQ